MGRYIGIAGSIASIVALFFVNADDFPHLKTISFAVGIIASVWAIFLEIRAYLREKPLKFDRRGNIDYMQRIISNEGRIIVFAGNLSWVDNDRIKNALLNKKGDLYLCANNTAPFLDELKAAGAHVYTYGDKGFSPKTRFTIIRPNSTNEKIAITAVLDSHNREQRFVYEISKDDKDFKNSWLVYVAEDLFNLMKIMNSEK